MLDKIKFIIFNKKFIPIYLGILIISSTIIISSNNNIINKVEKDFFKNRELMNIQMIYITDAHRRSVKPATRNHILKSLITNYNEESTLLIGSQLIKEVENICSNIFFQ